MKRLLEVLLYFIQIALISDEMDDYFASNILEVVSRFRERK